MTSIAVIAHRTKTFGGGLVELRKDLAEKGFPDPLWYEAAKSIKMPQLARRAVKEGAELIFIWGGDGSVQQCVNALAGEAVDIAILPAGTANLLAKNLDIPNHVGAAVDVGLLGGRRRLDVGVLNGERFAVMAGVGYDAIMMRDADAELKDRFGRLAYVWAGVRATHMNPRKVRIKIDGEPWFKGNATCVLIGQIGSLSGSIEIFPDAKSDDGLLEVGVVTAENALQWVRVLSRLAVDEAKHSPLTLMTQARKVRVTLDRPTTYELDGGARKATKKIRAHVEPGAINVCVPRKEQQ
jgi:YegS/Rv2252/BmrU family lipid kinase